MYSSGLTRGIWTQRSIRSRSGPEMRPAYRSTTAGRQWQRPSSSPAWPHGHGFTHELHDRAPCDRAAGWASEGSGGMSSLERLGDSAAARKVFARVSEAAEGGVPAITVVAPLPEPL